MKIKYEDIPEDGLSVSLEEHAPQFEAILRELNEGGTLPRLAGSLSLAPVGGSKALWVTGVVQTQLSLTCCRCLEPAEVPIDDTFALMAQSDVELKGAVDEEVELDSGSLDVSYFDLAEGLALDEVIREQLLLAIPSTVLCREDCKGICQSCGCDLNQEACQCGEGLVDPRFAVLASLKKS